MLKVIGISICGGIIKTKQQKRLIITIQKPEVMIDLCKKFKNSEIALP